MSVTWEQVRWVLFVALIIYCALEVVRAWWTSRGHIPRNRPLVSSWVPEQMLASDAAWRAGHLAETNQQGLHPLIRHARALAPHGSIRADLRGAENMEDNTVESLRWAIDHQHDTGPAAGSVDIVLPDEEPGQTDRNSGPRWLLGPWHDPQTHSASPPGTQMRERAPR